MSRLSKAFREILPVILVLILAGSLSYISFFPDLPKIEKVNEQPRQTPNQDFQEPPTSNPQVTILPPIQADGISTATETTITGVFNTILIVVLVFLGGSGLYLLLKYRRETAKYVLGSAFGFVTLVTVFFFAEEVFALLESEKAFSLEPWRRHLVEAAIAVPFGLFVSGVTISEKSARRSKNLTFMIMGMFAGALMATVTPVFITFPVLLSISLYDVYAVRHGPIKKIADDREISGLIIAYEADNWSLGLGDIVFYSMLPSSSLAYTMTHISRFTFYDSPSLVGILTPWIVFIAVAGVVVIGFNRTLHRLEGKTLVSGLYIPILSGCGAFGLCLLVLQLVNYVGWGWFVPLL